MARIRTIKPDFWTDETLTECSLITRLLFIGMWNFADDHGGIDGSIKQLKMKIFPADNVDVAPCIAELIAHGLLIEYSVDHKKYLHIKGFTKHQVINRPSKPQYPKFDESLRTHETLTEYSLTEGKGREGKGKEKALKPLSEYSDDFLKFWSLFPNKTAKGEAFKSWKKMNPPLEPVLNALSWQTVSRKWKDGYIPLPTTYINQKRWEDEPPQTEVQRIKTFEQLKLDATKQAMMDFVKGAPDAGHEREPQAICITHG